MIHIMRIDEMAIRSKGTIDTAVKNRDYKNSTEYAKKLIDNALENLENIIKDFPTEDAIDAIDTYNYLNEKDIRDRVYDTNGVDKYDVYFINTKNAQNPFTQRSGYNTLSDKADLIALRIYMDDNGDSRLYLGYDKTLKNIVMWINEGWTEKDYRDYTFNSFIDRCKAFEETEDAMYDSVDEEVYFDMHGEGCDYDFSSIYQAIKDGMDILNKFFKEFFEKVDKLA